MRYLSKSQYTRGKQCFKSLWLYRNKFELQDPLTPDQQAIMQQGTEVGALARKWIGGGTLITADHKHADDAVEETKAAIAAGAKVLYEAAFIHDDVLIRADIMMQVGTVWDLYEVKSTTKVEDEHLHDAAIQTHVLKGAGVRVGAVHIAHLNPDYTRVGELNLDKLFLAVRIDWPILDRMLLGVPVHLDAMKAVASAAEAPAVAIGPHCTKPHDCSFKGHCFAAAGVPDYSVFNLAGARMDKKTELWNRGIKTVDAIPPCSCRPGAKKCECGNKVTEYQAVQRAVLQTRKPHVQINPIRQHLTQLTYPLHFVDFEAVNAAIPPYDGTRPYQPLPFEASVHIRKEPGAQIDHFIYLADGREDPREGFTEFLLDTVKPNGTNVAYHMSYENGILEALAAAGGRAGPHLLSIGRRLWDLAEPFKRAWYADARFKGRWSIKAVLPVLVPDLSYKDLMIQDGAAAMRAYAKIMDPATTEVEREALRQGLKEYNALDTLAMVRILDFLEQLVGAPAGAR